MPRTKTGSLPTYRHHKARNLAVVTIDGKDYYLGPWNTPASKQKYAALIRAWQQQQEQLPGEREQPLTPNEHPTINELVLAYLKHARDYYKPYHGENKEAGCIADALAVVQELYGREAADTFRPKDLKIVRNAMIDRKWSRGYINTQINRVRRMFGHAVEEDLIPGGVYHALMAVSGLRKGTPGVRDTEKVRPVPIDHVKPVIVQSPPVLKSMLLFAYRTGARPGEVCALKPCYLDRTGKVWTYQVPPEANKTEHHDQERIVYIGPKAQRTLRRWLEGLQPDQYVFSPAKAEELRQEERRSRRKTPLYPSHQKRLESKRKATPNRRKRDHYDPASFRRAVKRMCKTVKVPEWAPNRLRHNAATRFRKKFGIEVARVLLGHRKLNTTEIYAEANRSKAVAAIKEMG